MIILLYFFASVFIVAGFMMLFAYRRSGRKELLLFSFIYSASGMAAGYSQDWWLLIVGFVVVWLLKFAGYDPDKPPKGQRASIASGADSESGKGGG